jgi:predicted GH43/DUF377 family glycosyl hydrolase
MLVAILLAFFWVGALDHNDYRPGWDDDEVESSLPPPVIGPAVVDLEEMRQPFVLETRRIVIPGYATAFNPTVLRLNGRLLFAFRIRDPQTQTTHRMGVVWMNENFELLSKPVEIEVRSRSPYVTKDQDPRLIQVGEKIYCVYSNLLPVLPIEIRRVFIAELQTDGERFWMDDPEPLVAYEGERADRWEKNWTPFDYRGELYLAYSQSPHKIFRPLWGRGACETVASTPTEVEWDWGTIRGGTQALMEGEEYLSFFHSSTYMISAHSEGKCIQHYFMGAYTFEKDPPFRITKVSPEPIVGPRFYHGAAHKTWKKLRVVFPGGFVADEECIWVVYGRQDFELWVVKLDKKGLLASLREVNAQRL